jgi:hypothetical protein
VSATAGARIVTTVALLIAAASTLGAQVTPPAPAGRGGGGGRGRGPMVVMTLTSPAFADGARPEPARRTTPDSLSANPRCCARRRGRTLWT